MKARRLFIVALSMFFGLAMRVHADQSVGDDGPTHYKSVMESKNQWKLPQNNPLTQKDLNAFSAQVHSVSIISTSESTSDILPASARPQGALQLDKVINPPK
jgi:hypothetical protein